MQVGVRDPRTATAKNLKGLNEKDEPDLLLEFVRSFKRKNGEKKKMNKSLERKGDHPSAGIGGGLGTTVASARHA